MESLYLVKLAIGIAMGYLLGSILPAYILGRRLRRLDIRTLGNRTAGISNAFRILGKPTGIITLIYDMSKGIAAIGIGALLGLGFWTSMLCGAAAIVGHIFPFYLDFKGGRGGGTASGIIVLYLLPMMFATGSLSIWTFAVMFAVGLLMYVSTHDGNFTGLVAYPFVGFAAITDSMSQYNLAMLALTTFLFAFCIYNISKRRQRFKPQGASEVRWWRSYIRPAAVLFLPIYEIFGKRPCLVLLAIVTLSFLALDISRIMHKKADEFFYRSAKNMYKASESKRFSSMTYFLISSFLCLLLFEKGIAFLSIIFLTFGDVFGKYFGMTFGRRHIAEKKTIEGSAAFLAGCLAFGFFALPFTGVPLWLMAIGALLAAFAEAFPFGLDDNMTVGIFSGAAMTAIKLLAL
ncbi:MAG: glycerol-3-phosphate acyltransferase [Candidatus Thermoplasmatota archaeon]|nr:glycerol-3-phosphate acyltransferase [Candidatus Thermoplasmatota archaeon]